MKGNNNHRGITGNRVIRYAKYSNKLVHYNLLSAEDRAQYFKAVKVLRKLSDNYCTINGLPLDDD